MKITHIHTDPKFINSSLERFENPDFENQLILLGNSQKFNEVKYKNAFVVPKEISSFSIINTLSQESDLIILYFIRDFETRLISYLPKKAIVGWWFFGYEIYNQKIPELIFSERTREALPKRKNAKNSLKIKFKKNILYLFPNLSKANREYKKGYTRIDYFFGMYKKEYDFLKQLGFKLPPFINRSIRYIISDSIELNKKKPVVIIGNSRNPNNNHLDILEIIKKTEVPKSIKFKLFFSYGTKNNYAQTVRIESSQTTQTQLIERFLSKNEYLNIYNTTAALVINGYRQMALDNIFTAIGRGVKVYLSEKNTTYDWLKEEKMIIFSIEKDLSRDLQNGNIFLTQKEFNHNIKTYETIVNRNTVIDFQKKIKNLMAQKNK